MSFLIEWDQFPIFGIISLVFWILASIFAYIKKRENLAYIFSISGLLVFSSFIALYWIGVERLPLRTMGETRLLYSLFLSILALFVYKLFKLKWIFTLSTVLAGVFIFINIFKPEIHDKTLMPILQSPWFAPHVILYMFAYSILGIAFIISVYTLITSKKGINTAAFESIDMLTRIGNAFLCIGLLIGSIWAKEAWGHYWTWDPKETWAAVTILAYMLYLHFRVAYGGKLKLALVIQIICFVLLQMAWYGLNLLPLIGLGSTDSMHLYN